MIKWREHGGVLVVSVQEVFPVNPEINSILLQGFNSMHNDRYTCMYAYLLSWQDLHEKTDQYLSYICTVNMKL